MHGLTFAHARRGRDRLGAASSRGRDPCATGACGRPFSLSRSPREHSRPGSRPRSAVPAVVETACRVFAKSSYRGSTTAQIARETGVTEPVLYRHFASKRELYLACLDAVWDQLRAALGQGARARGGSGDLADDDRSRPTSRSASGRPDRAHRPLDPGADRGRRRPRDPPRPAGAGAGGAQLRRRRDPAGPGRPAGSFRSATPTQRRGSSSRSACCRRSTAA